MPQENLHENTIELVWILYNKKPLRIRSVSGMCVRIRIQMSKSDPQKKEDSQKMYCFEVTVRL